MCVFRFGGENMKHLIWISGLLAAICYLTHDIVGGLLYPDYSFLTRAVSDLTGLDSPVRYFTVPLTLAYGFFAIVCVILSIISFKNKSNIVVMIGLYLFLAMHVVSAVGYTLFPLDSTLPSSDFKNRMHIVVTVLVVVLSISSLIVIAVGGFLKKKPHHKLSIYSIIAFVLMALGAILTNAAPSSVFGIVERFSTYSAVIYTCVLGFYSYVKNEKLIEGGQHYTKPNVPDVYC